MGEKKKKKESFHPAGRPTVDSDKKKKAIAFTIEPDLLTWVKEWAVRRDRSVSWAITYFIKCHRHKELAEKHLGQKVVR